MADKNKSNNDTGISQVNASTKINDYTSYYEDNQFSTAEEVTLAEDVVFDSFIDLLDVKFFYKVVTPTIDDINDEPEDSSTDEGTTSNYIYLDIPSTILWSTVKAYIQVIEIGDCNHWRPCPRCGQYCIPNNGHLNLPSSPEGEGNKINMVVLPGDLHTGRYKLHKGTIFLAHMLAGNMKHDRSRVTAISIWQKIENGGIAEETWDPVTHGSGRPGSGVKMVAKTKSNVSASARANGKAVAERLSSNSTSSANKYTGGSNTIVNKYNNASSKYNDVRNKL